MADAPELEVINYFIDEAGDPVLFDRRGKNVLVGEEGTSKYFNVQAKLSKEDACLQACDYFLWALQRHFEMGESRFIELMWPQVGEIHDLDITHGSRRGAFYTQQNPLVPQDE